MARKGALKVFRTPIGFHDAYVAATSRKAALAAWGAEKDLFASGSAELVTDPQLTEAPLAAPGEVIRLARGTLDEHLRAAAQAPPRKAPRKSGAASATAALEAETPPSPGGKRQPKPQPPPKPRPKPPAKPRPKPPPKTRRRPSRGRLDRAEAEVEALAGKAASERAELDKREAELLRQRKALNARQRRDADRLDARLELVREAYEAAMERWRRD